MQGLNTIDLQQIWGRTRLSEDALVWEFSGDERSLLRATEKYLRHWAWQHKRNVRICLKRSDRSIQTFELSGRYDPTVAYNFPAVLPMSTPEENSGIGGEMERFIVCASNPLPKRIYSMLEELGDSSGVMAIVHWQSQKQVVMNAACSNLPIGASLQECLNWSRHDYWMRSDLSEFERLCQQELDTGGNNSVEMTYRNFDPVDLRNGGDGDWMEATVQYTFIDCDRFGLFQLSRNLDFRKIAPLTT